jgi:hypothetical protein
MQKYQAVSRDRGDKAQIKLVPTVWLCGSPNCFCFPSFRRISKQRLLRIICYAVTSSGGIPSIIFTILSLGAGPCLVVQAGNSRFNRGISDNVAMTKCRVLHLAVKMVRTVAESDKMGLCKQ